MKKETDKRKKPKLKITRLRPGWLKHTIIISRKYSTVQLMLITICNHILYFDLNPRTPVLPNLSTLIYFYLKVFYFYELYFFRTWTVVPLHNFLSFLLLDFKYHCVTPIFFQTSPAHSILSVSLKKQHLFWFKYFLL